MSTNRSLSTQTAVLISGALIAVAVFFGLRTRPLPPDTARPSGSSAPRGDTGPAGTAGAVPPEGAPSPSDSAAVSPEVVAAQVMEALKAQRKALVKRCWTTGDGGKSTTPVTLHVNATFSATGQQLTLGLREDRATPLPELRQCVADALEPLEIPAPGAQVFVPDVVLTLP